MTPKEIDRIKCAIRHIQTAVDVDPLAVEIAVEALEKQIPKKPEKRIEYGTLFELSCPTCNTKIGYGFDFCEAIKKYNDMKNCIHCGQAIDWGSK